MSKAPILAILALSGTILVPAPGLPEVAESDQVTADPLAPFERVVGGQWHLGGSYIEFEWGVGHQSIQARSYFIVEGSPKLVSEGMWFWHPGEREIKGVFTAIDMPVLFFDYTTRFDDNRMVSNLKAYGEDGNETAYVETWEFSDATHYVWKLFEETSEGLQETMSGTYVKKERMDGSAR